MPSLPPNQQCQSTEGTVYVCMCELIVESAKWSEVVDLYGALYMTYEN